MVCAALAAVQQLQKQKGEGVLDILVLVVAVMLLILSAIFRLIADLASAISDVLKEHGTKCGETVEEKFESANI